MIMGSTRSGSHDSGRHSSLVERIHDFLVSLHTPINKKGAEDTRHEEIGEDH